MRLSTLVTRVWVAAVIAMTATVVGADDLRVERFRTSQIIGEDGKPSDSRTATEVIYIGERSARLDLEATSAIVRMADGVFVWLDHKDKAYAEVRLPLKLEDLLTDEEKNCLRQAPQALSNVQATVTATGETRVIDRWETRQLRVIGKHFSGFEFENDSWVTDGLAIDLLPYHQLVRNRAALSPVARGWISEFIAHGGYPVESRATRRSRGRVVRITELRLSEASHVPADETRYRPPADYSNSLSRPPIDVGCLRSNRGRADPGR